MAIPIYSSRTSSAASADLPIRGEWRGTSDTDYGTGANWAGSTVPGNGDIALFNSGSVAVAGSDRSAITLGRMAIHPSYTGQMGITGGTLRISAKQLYVNKSVGDISLDGTFDDVYIYDTPASSSGVTFAGQINNIYLFATSGTVNITAVPNNVFIMPLPGRSVHLVYGSGITGALGLRAYGDGFIDAGSGFRDLHVGERIEARFTGDAVLDNVTIYDRYAVVNHRGSVKVDGTLTIYGGRFTIRDNGNDVVTIDDLTTYDGGIADLRNGQGSVVLTNPATQWGGVILVDDGVVMTPA